MHQFNSGENLCIQSEPHLSGRRPSLHQHLKHLCGREAKPAPERQAHCGCRCRCGEDRTNWETQQAQAHRGDESGAQRQR